ncbi:Activator of stress genes 1 [Cytospora mali]|uniref:Activator of stress genes 1 n=1 Tax=Cytospora mali TaxID=578113 RepID=A0A194V0B2_CYTMA|nr:Activator of stress genes 1 [Valsa mali var. pyri (nom. inval.)]
MPAGCPPKRSSGAMDSPQDGPSPASKVKLPRLERGPEDFSQVVKNKLQSYTRTGQACDRCKNLECYVTDRVTGRTERRGYLQQLEREKNDMLTRLHDMEKLLEDKGIQIRPWQWSSAYGSATTFDSDNDPSRDQWSQFGSLWIKEIRQQHQKLPSGYSVEHPSPLSTMDARTVDARLGVAADNAPLNSINGTSLSILGTTIDVTSFDAPDMDGPPSGTPSNTPLYNKSIQSFYNSVARSQPPIEAPLPSREDAFTYSEWFFIMAGPFVPVLHKPTYFKLLKNIYDVPDFKASTAELAIVHMVFAMMYYQFGVRNGQGPEMKAQMNEVSNKHYHWCLDKTHALVSELSIAAVQALALIATHCRGFPKPGPAYHMATIAWARAMEMKLHRAFVPKGKPSNLENEMRKRLWWCVFMLVVTLYGRIGMPIPIRAEDFDVEMPICVPDEAITENGIIESERNKECYYLVGVAGFKLTYLFMELWNHIYSVRQNPKTYVAAVRRLEQQFREYEDNLPDEIRLGKCKHKDQVNAAYLEASSYEFLMCLRHPSRCITTDPEFIAENNRVSEDAARKMLRTANELARLKSLDTTWYQMAVYVAAMFTILAAHWERRFDVTPEGFTNLQADMNMGLFVISEVSKYIGVGSDSHIMAEISSVIDKTMASIENDMGTRRSSHAPTVQPHPQPHQRPQSGPTKHGTYSSSTMQQRHPRRSGSNTPTQMTNGTEPLSVHRTASMASYYNGPMTTPNTTYPQLRYPDLGHHAGPTPTTGTSNIQQPSYIPVTEGAPHQYIYAATAAAAQMNHHNTSGGSPPHPGSATHNPMVAYNPQTSGPSHPHSHPHPPGGGDWMTPSGHGINTVQQQQQQQVPNGGNTWQEWTNAIAMMDPSSQDRYSANALLTLNAGQRAPDTGVGVVPSDNAAQWPMLVYNPNVPGT